MTPGAQLANFFGGDADEPESAKMYKACRDAGINFFDTANQYSKGRSEEILGKLMRGERENLVIATKCFNPASEDRNDRGDGGSGDREPDPSDERGVHPRSPSCPLPACSSAAPVM